MENDKILVTNDDDLKFFIEETSCLKLHFESAPESRKRQLSDDGSEYSKRIRVNLESLDLGSSDTSSMDTSTDDLSDSLNSINAPQDHSEIINIPENSEQVPEPSQLEQSGKINIISVDVIPPTNIDESIHDEKNRNEEIPQQEERQIESNQEPQPSTSEQPGKKADTNRIVISDSSDDEPDTRNNRRRSEADGAYASSYAFTDGNGGFWARSQHRSGGRPHYNHHERKRAQEHFRRIHENAERQSRSFERAHHHNMEQVRQQVRLAQEHAIRAVRASTSAIPDLVSTFQAHFQRPLFRVADINQQIFGNPNRRF